MSCRWIFNTTFAAILVKDIHTQIDSPYPMADFLNRVSAREVLQ